MIQRIQSVFLLLVALVMISVLFLPIWNKLDVEVMESVKLNAFNLTYQKVDLDGTESVINTKPTFWISVLAIVAAGVALFSIFQYNNRLRQIQLGALNSLVMGGCLGFTYYYTTIGEQVVAPQVVGNFQIGFYIMAAALLFNALSNRFIRRDERLVKSADRIR